MLDYDTCGDCLFWNWMDPVCPKSHRERKEHTFACENFRLFSKQAQEQLSVLNNFNLKKTNHDCICDNGCGNSGNCCGRC